MAFYKIENVTAMYPKLDKTYRFDNVEGRSVPCAPTEDGAEYSINFELSEAKAKALHAEAMKVWAEFRAQNKNAPENPQFLPYKKRDDGTILGKAKIKGAYNGEPTRKPIQVDSQNNLVGEDFQLTTGSTVNIAVNIGAYNAGVANGVNLRLAGVQVVELAEMTVNSPFGSVSGGFTARPSAQAKEAAFAAQSNDPFGESKIPSDDDWVKNGGDPTPF